jgi:hypothetical protein
MGSRQTTVARNGKIVPSSSSSSSGLGISINWFGVLLGVILLGFCLLGITTQIQTNEAFVLGSGQVSTFQPNWNIFLQLPQLFFGGTSSGQYAANLVGWGVEVVFLALTTGYDLVHYAAGIGGATLGRIFKVIAWGIIGFNMWNDFNYGTLGSGIGGHFSFMIVAFIMVAFCGKIGVLFLEKGLGT